MGVIVIMEPRVKKVIAYMEEHYARDLSLERLARRAGLSCWYLCHLFKREAGESPSRYLKSLRLVRAKELLRSDSSLSVKEVMNKVGMRDQSRFARDFKTAYGMTPTEFRAHTSTTITPPRQSFVVAAASVR